MKHKYKRRTLDESAELAQRVFRAFVSDYLSKDEIEIYKPSDICPYIEICYAKISVSRDRSSEQREIIWKPEVPEYNGHWFS